MLVLTRKVGQTVLIGNEVVVVVTDIGWGGVRIGIETKPKLPIYRGSSSRRWPNRIDVPPRRRASPRSQR